MSDTERLNESDELDEQVHSSDPSPEPTEDSLTEPSPSLTDELATLIDDGRTYAEAELAFQKTRASLAGRKIGVTAGLIVLAVLLVHLALVALVVGLLIALVPPLGIWGSIAAVVGGLLLAIALVVYAARGTASGIGAMFKDDGDEET
jgi:hypothetical protein